MSHRRTGAAAAREVLLSVGKARTTSSAPPFSRTSSRNASAGRSSPNGLPPSLTVALAQSGSPTTCRRRLRDWQRVGVWQRLHQLLLDELGRDGRLDWSRASLNSVSVRAKRGAA
jgi:transposase